MSKQINLQYYSMCSKCLASAGTHVRVESCMVNDCVDDALFNDVPVIQPPRCHKISQRRQMTSTALKITRKPSCR